MGLDRNEIADALRRDITSGKYRAGDRLPGYRDLAAMFGAAPNTVGEAVRMLAAEGLVARRTTSRAVVLSPDETETESERLESARVELQDVHSELQDVRERLVALEDRVTDVLGKLNG